MRATGAWNVTSQPSVAWRPNGVLLVFNVGDEIKIPEAFPLKQFPIFIPGDAFSSSRQSMYG